MLMIRKKVTASGPESLASAIGAVIQEALGQIGAIPIGGLLGLDEMFGAGDDEVIEVVPSLTDPLIEYVIARGDQGEVKVFENGWRDCVWQAAVDETVVAKFAEIGRLTMEIREMPQEIRSKRGQIADWRAELGLKQTELRFGLWQAKAGKYYGTHGLSVVLEDRSDRVSLRHNGAHVDWLADDEGLALIDLDKEIKEMVEQIAETSAEVAVLQQRLEHEPGRLEIFKHRFWQFLENEEPELAELNQQGRAQFCYIDDMLVIHYLEEVDNELPELPPLEKRLLALRVDAGQLELPADVAAKLLPAPESAYQMGMIEEHNNPLANVAAPGDTPNADSGRCVIFRQGFGMDGAGTKLAFPPADNSEPMSTEDAIYAAGSRKPDGDQGILDPSAGSSRRTTPGLAAQVSTKPAAAKAKAKAKPEPAKKTAARKRTAGEKSTTRKRK